MFSSVVFIFVMSSVVFSLNSASSFSMFLTFSSSIDSWDGCFTLLPMVVFDLVLLAFFVNFLFDDFVLLLYAAARPLFLPLASFNGYALFLCGNQSGLTRKNSAGWEDLRKSQRGAP